MGFIAGLLTGIGITVMVYFLMGVIHYLKFKEGMKNAREIYEQD